MCNQFAVNKSGEQWQCCRVGQQEKYQKCFSSKFPVIETFASYELPSCMISTFSFKFDVHFWIPLDCPQETLELTFDCEAYHLQSQATDAGHQEMI